MSTPLAPLEGLLLRLAGEASSQTLKLDPASYPRLEALAGTRLRFDVLTPALPGMPARSEEPRTLLLTVQSDALTLATGSAEDAHTVITGTVPDIARLFLGTASQPDRADKSADVRIEGDEAALQAVAALFRDLEPDLAEPLAKIIGRQAADGLVGAAEAGFALLRSAAQSLAGGVRREARSNWVTDQAQDSLMDRMDDLRLRVDRLDARVRLAEEQLDPSGPGR